MASSLVAWSVAPLEDWSAGGHALSGGWITVLGNVVLVVLLAGFAFLVLRALRRRHWYRAAGVLDADDLRAVHDALAAAERRTVGEILPVVLERSDRHPGAAWVAALACGAIGSIGLIPWMPWNQPPLVLALQLALGALGYASARLLPDFQRVFVSEARAREMTEEQAFQEFHRYELSRTEARTGILLFVSLLERRAVVLADAGIDARVASDQWARTNELVLAGLRRGSLREGLVTAIASAGEVLAEHFPVAGGDRNEVPDRLIVRRE
jgi:putative membrane protein